MGLKIILKQRFIINLKKTTLYIKSEWGKKAAEDFKNMVVHKLELIASQPGMGSSTSIKNTRSVLVGKGQQNKVYYRVEKNNLVIIDIKDTRRNPNKNPFNKPA